MWLAQRRLHRGRFAWPQADQAIRTLGADQWQWLTAVIGECGSRRAGQANAFAGTLEQEYAGIAGRGRRRRTPHRKTGVRP